MNKKQQLKHEKNHACDNLMTCVWLVGSAVGVVRCSLVSSDSPPVAHWSLMLICEVLFECLSCLSSLESWMRDLVPFGTDCHANRLFVSLILDISSGSRWISLLLLVLFSFAVRLSFF